MPLKKLKLETKSSFINEMKLIATWIILYSFGNLLIQIMGFSEFIYQKLTILCQGLIFYFLISNNCFGYKIQAILPRAKSKSR